MHLEGPVRKPCQVSLSPSWIPFLSACSFRLGLGPFHSSCPLLRNFFLPGAQIWETKEVQSRKKAAVIGFPPDCDWGEARTHPLVYFPCVPPPKMIHAALLWARLPASVTLWDIQIGACTLLSLKKKSHFRLVDANNSDPITRNSLTKVPRANGEGVTNQRRSTGCQELQNAKDWAASELRSGVLPYSSWKALLGRKL